jgi:hypothetical protein
VEDIGGCGEQPGGGEHVTGRLVDHPAGAGAVLADMRVDCCGQARVHDVLAEGQDMQRRAVITRRSVK